MEVNRKNEPSHAWMNTRAGLGLGEGPALAVRGQWASASFTVALRLALQHRQSCL